MKIAQVAPHERVRPKYHQGTECVVSFRLQSVFQRAGERRLTATRMARDYVQQCERLIAKNQDVSEAS
jgi:intergrase/recombinase